MTPSAIHNPQFAFGDPSGPGLFGETVIKLNDAAREIGRITGRRPSKTTVWRWATKGIRARRGNRREVRLETMVIGRTRYTSLEALERFSAALDGRKVRRPGPPGGPRSEVRKQKAIDAARAKLVAAGWM